MGSKILVVDNHPLVLKLIANLLEKSGHEVRIAEDGLSALDILKSYASDIIFVDLVMPNISGEKLCRIIRNMPHLQGYSLSYFQPSPQRRSLISRPWGRMPASPRGV